MSQRRVRATWRSLVALIWEAIKANRMLVVWVYLIGFCHAFFSKAVILLAKPFLEFMGVEGDGKKPGDPAPEEPLEGFNGIAQDIQDWIDEVFRGGAMFVRDLLGLQRSPVGELFRRYACEDRRGVQPMYRIGRTPHAAHQHDERRRLRHRAVDSELLANRETARGVRHLPDRR